MNHLIILAHPNRESYCAAIAKRLNQALPSSILRDLHNPLFPPVLSFDEMRGRVSDPELLSEQEAVKRADHLIFIFPVWWYDRPAVLKGWFDRVFSYGFAYTVENGRGKGLLTDKEATVIATFGSTQEEIAQLHPGAAGWVTQALEIGTLRYCGFSKVENHPLFAINKNTHEQRVELLNGVVEGLVERFSGR